jgi:hypothetical protein
MQHTGYILDYVRPSLRSSKCAITHLLSHLLLLAVLSCVLRRASCVVRRYWFGSKGVQQWPQLLRRGEPPTLILAGLGGEGPRLEGPRGYEAG